MIDFNDIEILENILNSEKANEYIKYIITEYAKKSVQNASNVLQMITSVANIQLKLVSNESENNYQAAFWAITQRNFTTDKKAMFSSMVPVCKAMFKEGNAKGKNIAMQKYFAEFVELFQDKKVFSWDKDKDWADNFRYTEYLKLVESQLGSICEEGLEGSNGATD